MNKNLKLITPRNCKPPTSPATHTVTVHDEFGLPKTYKVRGVETTAGKALQLDDGRLLIDELKTIEPGHSLSKSQIVRLYSGRGNNNKIPAKEIVKR